ncbi:MAG: hypothetical protein WCR56_04510, partial [Bacilli bacterium]
EFDSPFEEDVYNFLVSKQFGVDTQVGCSGYRIDMGVKNRTNSDYVLAIECDGKTYHSGKCARDRDRLRQEVLEEKGWKFYRIWSTDWFKDRRDSEENLVLAIEKALKNEALKEEIAPAEKAADAIPVLAVPIAPTEKRLKDYFPKYVSYYEWVHQKGTGIVRSSIQRFLEAVVDKEQPITSQLLLRRLATYLDRQKITSVVLNAFKENVPYSYKIKKSQDDDSYYIDPNCYQNLLRLGGDRKVDDVPHMELQNGIIKIVEIEGRIDKNGLSRELLCLFDMSKLSDSMSSYIEAAIKKMLEKQTLKEESDGSLCLNIKTSF